MARMHLMEIIDQDWCPVSLRDGLTDTIQFVLCMGNHYRCVVKDIRRVLEILHSRCIIDLCSGGGGPWPRLYRVFEEQENYDVKVYLTDKFVNIEALTHIRNKCRGKVDFYATSVDALQLPAELRGFRTLFTSFHHFREQQAHAILADAVRNKQGIGIFEFTQRSPLALMLMCFAPLLFVATVPFIRPFKWSRILWTYIIPLLPLVGTLDGAVSCLRTYSPEELEQLTASFAEYHWEIGYKKPSLLSPIPITSLIGYPRVIDN